MWLCSIDDAAHFLLFFVRQFNIPRGPIFLQSVCLGGARNSNHALRSNPSECDLSDLAASPRCKLFDLVHDRPVFIEVFALEFGNYGPQYVSVVGRAMTNEYRETHLFGGNHQVQSHPETGKGSRRRANHGPAGCTLRKSLLTPWPSRLSRPSRAPSQKPNIPPGRHRSLQLSISVSEMLGEEITERTDSSWLCEGWPQNIPTGQYI